MSGFTIAVPRGALFDGTLDLLDTLGVDTAEVRSNDRKLLFEDAGIVTMRPSDVPTYVEHGSADVGITGKDVLLEQSHRNVYELVDLGYGRCRMVVAARDGDPIGSALRRLGRVRIATKYPRRSPAWWTGSSTSRPLGARSRRTGCGWWRRSASARPG
jgi:ATP phosphoribosyltransferase